MREIQETDGFSPVKFFSPGRDVKLVENKFVDWEKFAWKFRLGFYIVV